MKTSTLLFFLFTSTFAFSQTVRIDTLKIHYTIKDVVNITSLVPQLTRKENPVATNKINADIKDYFMASIQQDSVQYVNTLLSDHELRSLAEYFKLVEKGEIKPDSEDESFEITLLSDQLLNFTYSYQILPAGGQYQFLFKSVVCDLRTGNKLDFDDFINIDNKTLITAFRQNGYFFPRLKDLDNPYEKLLIDPYDEYVEPNLNDLFEEKDRCITFYFKRINNEIYLMFKFLCAGPALLDYGIEVNKLLPFVKYYEFKNEYKLWGKNIQSLRGYDFLSLGEKIDFDEYSINIAGGYLLAKDKNFPDTEYGISMGYSTGSVFYLFLKYESIDGKRKATIKDILEINRTDIKPDRKVTEYCQTKKGADGEIFALVKDTGGNPEYYTKIIKAWRANRKTEKIEVVAPKKVIKCGNESYGI